MICRNYNFISTEKKNILSFNIPIFSPWSAPNPMKKKKQK